MAKSSTLERIVAPSSVVDQVVDRLESAIVSGELVGGAKLSEQGLATSMGISRGPLREALRRLEGRGLIERVPNIGARVTPLLKQNLEEILVIRESLESLACRLAAENISDDELKVLDAIIKRHAARVPGERAYHQSPDQDFHLAIMTASRSQRLIGILRNEIYYFMRFHRYRSAGRPGRSATVLKEHQAIVDALAAHNPDAAEAAMRRHLVNAHASIRKGLSE